MDLRQTNGAVIFKCLPFDQLDNQTLYNLLALRTAVFSVEQNCAYQDMDGKDTLAWHLLAYVDGVLVGVARLLMPGESYPGACSIGRIACRMDYRSLGIGKKLMAEAVRLTEKLFPDFPVCIGAQRYLHAFYSKFGFEVSGSPYLEDGIVHVKMVRQPAGT